MWSVDTFKKDSKHKEDDYFPISWCQFRVAGGQSPSSRSEWKAGTQPGQDALPSRRTRARAHTHILGTWKEIGIPRENPHRHGENVRTPHRQWPLLGIDSFFPIEVVTKRYGTKQHLKTCTMLLRQKEGRQLSYAEWVLKTNSLLFTIKTRKAI